MAIEITDLRGKLVERLKQVAGYVQGVHHDDRLAELVLVYQAIQALDVVIAAGGAEEPGEIGNPITVTW